MGANQTVRMPRLAQRLSLQIIVVLLILLTACASKTSTTSTQPSGTTTPLSPVTSQQVQTVIRTVLQNIKDNGFDSQANGGQGGLWIDWRYGTNPLDANGGKCSVSNGAPTCQGTFGHDRLTDLRYIHNLWWYEKENPSDTQFASEIQRYTPIIKQEWSACTDDRGWIYDEWMDIYSLSQDSFYKQCAQTIANYYFTQWYHPENGALYQTSSTNPTGAFRTEDAIGMGAALIEAGAYFGQPQWSSAGKTALSYLRSHTYLPQYHVYLHSMDNVVLPDGTLNPDPSIFKTDNSDSAGSDSSSSGGGSSAAQRNGANVKAGSMGSEAFALLRAYQASQDTEYLNEAVDLLNQLSPTTNPLGLWDSQYGGYFYAILFDGSDYKNPGKPTVRTGQKEAGRQLQVLRAVHLANVLAHGQLQNMETTLLEIAVERAYYVDGHGYLYSVDPDWTPHLRHGNNKTYVTTEAMGIALESLLSVEGGSAEP